MTLVEGIHHLQQGKHKVLRMHFDLRRTFLALGMSRHTTGVALWGGRRGKLLASDAAIRTHEINCHHTEFDAEPYFRDAPRMIVGEGTKQMDRNILGHQPFKRNSLRP
jgi:hypothetical protein